MPIPKDEWDKLYKFKTDADYKPEGSHGSIQWKGTDVCIDIYCQCGFHSHIDAESFSYFTCHGCGRTFAVGCNVKLIELNDEMKAIVRKNDFYVYTDTDGEQVND